MADTGTDTTDRKPRAGTVPKAAPQLNSGERLLTPKDAANLLRLSLSWLAKARMRGDGPPFVKFGRSIRYAEGTLVQWTESSSSPGVDEREVGTWPCMRHWPSSAIYSVEPVNNDQSQYIDYTSIVNLVYLRLGRITPLYSRYIL